MKKIFFGIIIILFLSNLAFRNKETYCLNLHLKSNKEIYKLDEPIILDVEITNCAKRGVWIIIPESNLEEIFRYPHCIFTVMNQNNFLIKNLYVPCKVVTPLSPKEFIYLNPNQSVKIYKNGYRLNDFKKMPEGTYAINFLYSTKSEKEQYWFGLYSDDYWAERNKNIFWRKRAYEVEQVKRMLVNVPKTELISNTIAIKIFNEAKYDALKIAEEVCKKEDWPWFDVNIIEYSNYWDVTTNSKSLGRNAFIRIDKKTGKIKEKHLTGP